MKILTAEQIRGWDEFTIKEEPVASIDLMERAAQKCFDWLDEQGYLAQPVAIFCGKGNNGGDGLALARMLAGAGCSVAVYILETGHRGTDDFQTNLAKLHRYPSVDVHYVQDENHFHPLSSGTLIIDALFGTGLSRPPEGMAEKLVEFINKSRCEVVSIDIPSGLSADQSSIGNTIVSAGHTLSFQCYKLAFLMAENAAFTGCIHILDIGLHPSYLQTINTPYELTDEEIIRTIYKPRNAFAHKGNFGHALIAAGSYGKIGAAILAAKACLRSGAGLLTAYIPKCGYDIMQTAVPEAMVMTDILLPFISEVTGDCSKYMAAGIGPGIGTASETRSAVRRFFSLYKNSIVADADALNCIAVEKDMITAIPQGSVLTPHPGEFERLFGESLNDFERTGKALHYAELLKCIIVLKGHHSFIAVPGGKGYFNNTGNAGMATAGSGDVLTGIVTGLMAQGYSPEQAAIFGTYLHGLAGDLAATKYSQEAMIAGDIIESLGEAFKSFY